MKFLKCVCFVLSLLAFNLSYANGYADDISRCLSDSTSGKDRKDLARWVFTVMATHPEILKITSVTPKDRDSAEQAAGQLYNKLLTQDCKPQIEAAFKNKDATAARSAFEYLGKLAMQELMADPNVTKSFSGITKYIDFEKLRPPQQ